MAFLQTRIIGEKISNPQKKEVVAKFQESFFYDSKKTYWTQLPVNSEEIDKSFFSSQLFQSQNFLYFLIRINEIPLFKITTENVSAFFYQQQPFEGFDIYVFEENFRWCVFSSSEFKNDEEFHIYFSKNK